MNIQPLWKKIVTGLTEEISGKKLTNGDSFYSLQEICQKYGVSTITAKRVFSELERAGWIRLSKGKRPAITRNYRPVEIKVFIEDNQTSALSHFLVVQIVSGIEDAARKTGCKIKTFSEPDFLQKLHQDDAAIVFTEVFADAPFEIKKKNVVVVNTSSPLENHASVGTDLKQAEYLAVKHALSLGHRRIGFLNGTITNPWYTPRYEGYLKGLRSAGIKQEWGLIKETSGYDPEEDWHAMDELMRLKNPPTMIITANDFRSLHILSYCEKHGIHVPKQISLIGMDNTPESSASKPQLTTVDTGLRRIGSEAVMLLLSMTNGKATKKNLTVPPKLIVRKSTAAIKN